MNNTNITKVLFVRSSLLFWSILLELDSNRVLNSNLLEISLKVEAWLHFYVCRITREHNAISYVYIRISTSVIIASFFDLIRSPNWIPWFLTRRHDQLYYQMRLLCGGTVPDCMKTSQEALVLSKTWGNSNRVWICDKDVKTQRKWWVTVKMIHSWIGHPLQTHVQNKLPNEPNKSSAYEYKNTWMFLQ